MNKLLLAILLIAGGGVLLYLGNQRRESVAGAAERVGKDVATAFDGKARVSEETMYFIGGGALILVGLVIALRRSA